MTTLTTGLVDQVKTAVVDGITQLTSSIGGIIVIIVPIALSIYGAVMVTQFGVKLFKKLTG